MMLKIALLLHVLAAMVALGLTANDKAVCEKKWKHHHENYVKHHNQTIHKDRCKKGDAACVEKCHQNFLKRCIDAEEHNRRHDAGQESYRKGTNEFSHWDDEHIRDMKGFQSPASKRHQKTTTHRHTTKRHRKTTTHRHTTKRHTKTTTAAPTDPTSTGTPSPSAAVDWRPTLDTGIKNQGQCGSCWTFSTSAMIEGALIKAGGPNVSLSEQQLVDCAGEGGCNGGFPPSALQYVISNKGQDTLDSYPYTAQNGQCQWNSANSGGTITNSVSYNPGSIDEVALAQVVAEHGLVGIGINANGNFGAYKSGIFDDPTCTSAGIDHAVTIVGYGTENGNDYWIIKNSWGTTWGDDGYIRFIRGKNMCGILDGYPCYAIV